MASHSTIILTRSSLLAIVIAFTAIAIMLAIAVSAPPPVHCAKAAQARHAQVKQQRMLDMT